MSIKSGRSRTSEGKGDGFMRRIVSAEQLYQMWIHGEAAVVDCRFVMGQPQAGYEAYQAEHIPGARYLDLEKDLSAPVREDGIGGRHPLPDPEELAQKLTEIGISNHTTVVAYDEQGGAIASRLWWLLTYLGHDRSFVLDGGFGAWKQRGYPVVSAAEERSAPAELVKPFVPHVRHELVVTAEDILRKRKLIEEGRVVLIDSRDDARYRGYAEPIDKQAGHIPGARHWFWKGNLDPEGRFRTVKEQIKRFESLQGVEEIIVYCGSGVTACPNILALQEIGFTNVKLYAGSWSDWISDASRPIAKDMR